VKNNLRIVHIEMNKASELIKTKDNTYMVYNVAKVDAVLYAFEAELQQDLHRLEAYLAERGSVPVRRLALVDDNPLAILAGLRALDGPLQGEI